MALSFKPRRRDGDSGAMALEFALVAPIFLLLIFAIVSYGGYFWIAHSLQTLAQDSARAAVAGLDNGERLKLASDYARSEAAVIAPLQADNLTVTPVINGQGVQVTLRYDASDSGFYVFAGLVPMPPAKIERRATALTGGF